MAEGCVIVLQADLNMVSRTGRNRDSGIHATRVLMAGNVVAYSW